jgi:hypothetical protein
MNGLIAQGYSEKEASEAIGLFYAGFLFFGVAMARSRDLSPAAARMRTFREAGSIRLSVS